MNDVPDSFNDYPPEIEETEIELARTTLKLEKYRRQKRNMKTDFKMEARESDASNSTERKAYVKEKKQESSLYQKTQDQIENLTLEQARLRGRLKRLETELDFHIEASSELPNGVTVS
jgi:predicted nuclease with TOPRIM domain